MYTNKTRLLRMAKQLNKETIDFTFVMLSFCYALMCIFCNCYSIVSGHFLVYSRTKLKLRDAAFEARFSCLGFMN